MKNVYLIYLSFLLFTFKGYPQGSDVIFWLDNSGSISNLEYTQMTSSVQAIMEKVIVCNPNNRISIVQYGSTGDASESKIWIETPFTNVVPVFTRRNAVGIGDFAHEALGLIGNALDGIPNPGIVSPITSLSPTAGNSLVIYFFTDATRNSPTSYIVNTSSPGMNTSTAFQNYTTFKTIRNAKFVVTIVSPNANATQAAAAVASTGGTYTGIVESYPTDPDGAGITPRFLLNKTDFIMTPAEINNTTEEICSIAIKDCLPDLVLISPTHDVNIGTHDNRQASNSITASNSIISNTSDGGVGIYHAGNTIVLKPGFHSMYRSRFRAYIQECPSDFVGRKANLEPNKNNGKEEKISLFPNPSSTSVTIMLNSSLIQHISIVSMDGRIMLDKKIKEAEKHEVAVNDYKEGVYLVTVTTVDGKIFKSKLVKN
ncbi:3-coathanger stack domain-containing protein [Flavobacterium lindanitolerans]|uniref:Secreted protein (Por secretion system target) n=1 Tax=Flavobacterium lindanitolerans TaxID=428988 RepID=A0A497UGZ2_9FLAO|nr:3-coathanger stack domain-containing protein [Flavobacterium lindanitolerans]MBC8644627.1 T9SS type A sorting domain-containing protein [Flavobacterium lindanitolerans]PKW20461.1 putative secreted protein (Por secretion system target) [Flavobacterium lindanitolerans]RLJ23903.1 putative secreted protein (Por secretion system target) [Flavobacterium lindanitolerans]